MTVQEMIDLLEDCDPNAIVTDFEGDEIISVNDLGETVEIWN
jgi:hypothetical protein